MARNTKNATHHAVRTPVHAAELASFTPSKPALAVAAALAFASPSWSNPTGGQVVSGQAAISAPTATSVVIDQASNKAIINWNSFSIGANESVRFNQPSASSIALNRVLGNTGSEIFGSLSANGQIFLINPNGVLMGRGAQISAAGFLASSLGITDSDFLGGRYRFTRGTVAGSVINEGSINTSGGYAALIAPNVENHGLISARLGSVGLAAGDRVTLDFTGDGLMRLGVDQAALTAAIRNSGTITADGGRVVLSAKSANALLDTVLNNDGVIRADTLVDRNGIIALESSAGIASNSGSLLARGLNAGETGGTVSVTAPNVLLTSTAVADASGVAGGGNIFIGGNWQGQGPLANAQNTLVATGALLKADATGNGDGGQVIVWADGNTAYGGSISATGGPDGGNGGKAEVSGRENLNFQGTVNLSAAKGNAGTLLLDPLNLFIVKGATGSGDQDGNIVADALSFTVADTASNTISVGKLQGLGNVNITLQARNKLTVGDAGGADADVDLSATLTTKMLTLQAGDASTVGGGDIVFNAGSKITTGGGGASGGVTLIAGDAAVQKTGSATLGAITVANSEIKVTAQKDITLNAALNAQGLVLLTTSGGAGSTISQSGAGTITAPLLGLTTAGANVTLNSAPNAIGILGGVNLGTGALNFKNSTALNVNGPIGASGGITLESAGAMALNGAVNAGNGNVSLTTTGGGANTISQGAPITAGTLTLSTAGANADLGAANNLATKLGAVSLGSGALNFKNDTALKVTVTVAAAGGITLQTRGALMLDGTLDAGNSAITLNHTEGGITDTANGGLIGSSLTVSTINADANLTAAAANNKVSKFTSINVGNALFAYSGDTAVLRPGNITAATIDVTNTQNINFDGPVTASGNISFLSSDGLVTAGGASITTSGNITVRAKASIDFTQDGGSPLNAATGNLTLISGTSSVAAKNYTVGNTYTVQVGTGTPLVLGNISVGGFITAGNVALVANTIDTQGFSAFVVPGEIAIAPVTATTAMSVGDPSVVGALALPQTFLDTMTSASILTFGRANAIIPATPTLPNITPTPTTTAGQITVGTTNLTKSGVTLNLHSNVASGAAIVQTGTLTVGAGGNGTLGVTTAGGNVDLISGGNAVSTLGAVSTGGDLEIKGVLADAGNTFLSNTTGNITQTVPAPSGGNAISNADLTVSAPAGAITLPNSANNFSGEVKLSNGGAGNIAITNSGGLLLGTSSFGTGTLTVTALGGPITQSLNSTGLTQANNAGAATFNAGTSAITLDKTGNTFTGQVSLTGGTTEIFDKNQLSVVLNTTGNTKVTGNLVVAGTTIGDLTLDAKATPNGSITFGDTKVTGNLNAKAEDFVNQSPGTKLEVTLTTLIDASKNNSAITLTGTGNDFGGAVTLSGSVTQITDKNALTLGTLATGNLTAISTGPLNLGQGTVTGNLAATSNGGTVSQTAALTVTDTLTLSTAGGSATLNTAINAVKNLGASTLGTGELKLLDAGGLTVTGAVGATGGISLNTSGALAVNNTLDATGSTVSLTTTSGATSNITQGAAGKIVANSVAVNASGDVTLDAATNAFNSIGVTGGAITLRDTSALNVTALANGLNKAVDIRTGGALTLPAAAIDTGTATLTLASSAASVTTNGTLAGSTSTITGVTGITLGGNVTTSGDQSYTGAVTLNAPVVTLTGATPAFTAGVVGAGKDLTLSFTGTTAIDGAAFTGIKNLISNNGGTSNLTGTITTTGTQTYTDVVVLTGTTTTAAAANLVSFGSPVNATTAGTQSLTVSGAGGASFAGAVGGATPLASVAVTGATILGGNVTTTAAAGQTYTGGTTLTVDEVLNAGAANPISLGVVTGAGKNLTTTGPTTITSTAKNLGALIANQTLTTTGAIGAASVAVTGVTTLGGNVTTTGDQGYTGAVTLNAPVVTLTGATPAFTAGVVGAGKDLTLSFTGTTAIDGAAFTGIKNLISNNGGTSNLTGTITTTGTQTYTDVVVLTGTTTTAAAANLVSFGSPVNATTAGTQSLTVSGAGGASFAGAVGGATPLASVAVTGATILGGNVTTTAAAGQTYTGGATLTVDEVLNAGAANPISLGIVTGAGKNLTTTGATSITSTATNLGALVVNQSLATTGAIGAASVAVTGPTTLGGNVTTTAAAGQTYTGGATLTIDEVLNAGAANPISLGVVTGAGKNLTTTGVTSITSTASSLGALIANQTLTTTGAIGAASVAVTGATNLGGNVTTTGTQTYSDTVTLGANTIVTGVDNTFASTINGAKTLSLVDSGTTTFGGIIGGTAPLASLTTDAAGTTAINSGAVNTTGAQTYNDAVTLRANTIITGVGNTFASTINGAKTLSLVDSGTTTFGGIIGGTAPLISLTTDAAGATAINGGAITTTGAQTYNDAVTLGANTIITGIGNTFASTINGAKTLTVNDIGSTTFGGIVGGTGVLTSLTTDAGGSTTLSGGTITTTGAQTYNDAVTLGANTIITGVGITFASTISGAKTLSLVDSATTTFGGIIGGTAPLAGLTTDAAGATAINGGEISTTGAITLNDAVSGNNVSLNAGAGSITAINAGNDFTGTIKLTGGTIEIVDKNQLSVVLSSTSTSKVTGNLDVSGVVGTDLIVTTIPDAPIVFVGDTAVGGNLTATAGGSVTQNAGTTLTVAGTSRIDAGKNASAITLTNAANDFGGAATFIGGTVQVTDLNALTAVLSTTGVATLNAGTALTVSGAAQGVTANAGTTTTVTAAGLNGGAGAVQLVSPGNLTLDGAVSSTAAGNAVTLVTTTGNFTNNAGAAAVTAPAGRFLIYSGSPLLDSKGGLTAPNTRYGTPFDPTFANIPFAGSGFLYRIQPGLTITADDAARVVGTANPAFTFTPTGFIAGDTAATALAGAPALTTPATAASVVGAYPINAAAGTLTSPMNYILTFAPGTLTVLPNSVTVTANNQVKFEGASDPVFTFTAAAPPPGFITTGALTRAPGETAGNYNISIGSLASAGLVLNYVAGALTIVPNPIVGIAAAATGTTTGIPLFTTDSRQMMCLVGDVELLYYPLGEPIRIPK